MATDDLASGVLSGDHGPELTPLSAKSMGGVLLGRMYLVVLWWPRIGGPGSGIVAGAGLDAHHDGV
jgi:hypothetical protein